MRLMNREIEYKTLEGSEYYISVGFYGEGPSDLYSDGFEAYFIKNDHANSSPIDEKHSDYKEIAEFIEKYTLDNAVDICDDLMGYYEY